MDEQITVKFWGVRGSYPVPGSSTAHFGGNTASVEITAGDTTLIFDAGTGIIPLGRSLVQRSVISKKPVTATLLFSHLHHDHTQGFLFFAPAFIPRSTLFLYGPDLLGNGIERILTQTMFPPAFPLTLNDLQAAKKMGNLGEKDMLVFDEEGIPSLVPAETLPLSPETVCVRCLRSHAHPGGVMAYRVEWYNRSIVYATDTEGYANLDQKLAVFAHGADLLIHDAQYTDEHYLGLKPGYPSTQGYGHSTASMACDLARAAGVGQLALFHYDPSYDDQAVSQIEQQVQRRFAGAFAPYEGLELHFEVEKKVPRPSLVEMTAIQPIAQAALAG